MIELLRQAAPELVNQWKRTFDYKTNEWKTSVELVQKAFSTAGIKAKLPSNLQPADNQTERQTGFFEVAYQAASVGDKPLEVLRFGREQILKELEKSVALIKHVKGQLNTIDDWKDKATAKQKHEVLNAEEHMRLEMQKYDRMADDSDRGFFTTAGLGCGFGAIALIAHVVLMVMGSGGFLHGPVMYVVLGLSILPIVIGVFMQITKSAQRAAVEAQLFAVVREVRKHYQAACDAAERQAKEHHKKLVEEIRGAEEAHYKLLEAYRLLGNEPPDSLKQADSNPQAA